MCRSFSLKQTILGFRWIHSEATLVRSFSKYLLNGLDKSLIATTYFLSCLRLNFQRCVIIAVLIGSAFVLAHLGHSQEVCEQGSCPVQVQSGQSLPASLTTGFDVGLQIPLKLRVNVQPMMTGTVNCQPYGWNLLQMQPVTALSPTHFHIPMPTSFAHSWRGTAPVMEDFGYSERHRLDTHSSMRSPSRRFPLLRLLGRICRHR